MEKINLEGKKFGRWTVIREAKERNWQWECVCECGTEKDVRRYDLLFDKSKSCGCTRHRMWGTRIHNIWAGMKKRCLNPKNNAYKDYGGRGIKVCEEWKNFENFWKWAENNGYEPSLTIERRDNDKGYCPSNCIWATTVEQNQNKTSTIKYKGEIAKHASLRLGGSPSLISSRLKKGWAKEKAFTVPVVQKNRPKRAV